MTLPADEPVPVARTDVKGHGDPVVLVPGALTGWLSWEPHAEVLARERRVVRTQLLSVELGLRRAPLPAGYGLRTETEALARALDALRVSAADFVGWSYGGGIALDLALNEPERVRTLTLIEPSAMWVLRRLDRMGPEAEAYLREVASYGPGPVSEVQLVRFLRAVGVAPPGVDPCTMERWPLWRRHRHSLRIGRIPDDHEDELERLHRLDRPVLLFEGEGSTRVDRDIVEALARELPDARLEELPGGHALPLVSQERFLAILSAFLRRPERA